MNKYNTLICRLFLVMIFLLPSVYLFINFTNKEELVCALLLFIESIFLLWFQYNIDNPKVQDMIIKYL